MLPPSGMDGETVTEAVIKRETETTSTTDTTDTDTDTTEMTASIYKTIHKY